MSKEAIVKKLKHQHKIDKVYAITVEDETAYYKEPGRQELSAFLALQQQGKEAEGLKVILNSCFLDGDRKQLEELDYFLAAAEQLQEMIVFHEVQVEELEGKKVFTVKHSEDHQVKVTVEKLSMDDLGLLTSFQNDPLQLVTMLLEKKADLKPSEMDDATFMSLLPAVESLVSKKVSVLEKL